MPPTQSQATEDEQIPPQAPGAIFPAVVARVNGKAIFGRDLEQKIQEQLAPIGNPKWTNLKEDYRQELTAQQLGTLIAQELLYQKAVSIGMKATPAEAQAELAKVAKNFSSDGELNRALADRGMDRASLSREIDRSLTVAKYVQETISKKITITPAEVADYYSGHKSEFDHPDMIRSSHILILVPQGATDEQEKIAQQRAVALLARVKKGEDFAKLAKENSMDDQSASNGGDLGLLPKGQLASEYEDAAFALQVGGISDVVRSQYGYHIIKVTDRKPAGTATLDEVRTELTDYLNTRKTDQELQKVVDGLRGQAKIELMILTGGRRTGTNPAPGASRP